MHSTILISALCGLAAAAPRPQKINVDALKDLPTPSVLGPEAGAASAGSITYNPTSAAKEAAAAVATDPIDVTKRGLFKRDCTQLEPDGTGPIPGDGSVSAYLDPSSELSTTAQAAGTPTGYTKAFTNLQGSVQEIGYLTYKVLPGTDYDVDGCASFCNSVQFCLGFNIFYERDPKYTPDTGCANPAPVTNIKCSLYGYPVAGEAATNTGQWRGPEDANGEAFHVVIAGSNGYSKINPYPSPAAVTNFTGPSELLNGAINAPLDNGYDTYLGYKMYTSPYDPSLCAAACQAQTAYDHDTAGSDGTYKPCNFFNAYILSKNNIPQATYCSFYTRSWDASYAVNTGYYSGSDVYSVSSSFTYSLTTPDPGHV